MKEADIVLVSITQADDNSKLRPALILREMPGKYNDVLVCGVSTQLHLVVEGFDEIITPTDSEFHSSGLLATSLIRFGFLAVLPLQEQLAFCLLLAMKGC